MRVNCREQIANPAEPVNGQDERRKCAAVDSPARLCCSVIKRATAQDAAALCHYSERGIFHDRTRKVSRTYPASCTSHRCVANIMKNERRWGDLEARKSIVVDYKLGKVTKNNGNRCSAYVPEHHEAIVSPGIARAAHLVASP